MSSPAAVSRLQKSQPRTTGHGLSCQRRSVSRVSLTPWFQTSSLTLITPSGSADRPRGLSRGIGLLPLEDSQVVGQALGRDLGARIAHALHPATVHEREPALMLVASPLGRDGEALPHRLELAPGADKEADPGAHALYRQEVARLARRVV